VLPTANEGGVLGYEVVNSDDDLNPTEQIMRQAKETIRFGSNKKKKKKKVRSSVASMAGSMRSMSIAASKRDTGYESEYTEESYHSSLSGSDSNASETDAAGEECAVADESDDVNSSSESESDSDDSESVRSSIRHLEFLNKSRHDRMKRLVPIKTRTVPGLAGLSTIVSLNNDNDSGSKQSAVNPVRTVTTVNPLRTVTTGTTAAGRRIPGYDPRIDDDEDSFASPKSSGSSKSRSHHDGWLCLN
jgi:hypothetical protein